MRQKLRVHHSRKAICNIIVGYDTYPISSMAQSLLTISNQNVRKILRKTIWHLRAYIPHFWVKWNSLRATNSVGIYCPQRRLLNVASSTGVSGINIPHCYWRVFWKKKQNWVELTHQVTNFTSLLCCKCHECNDACSSFLLISWSSMCFPNWARHWIVVIRTQHISPSHWQVMVATRFTLIFFSWDSFPNDWAKYKLHKKGHVKSTIGWHQSTICFRLLKEYRTIDIDGA